MSMVPVSVLTLTMFPPVAVKLSRLNSCKPSVCTVISIPASGGVPSREGIGFIAGGGELRLRVMVARVSSSATRSMGLLSMLT